VPREAIQFYFWIEERGILRPRCCFQDIQFSYKIEYWIASKEGYTNDQTTKEAIMAFDALNTLANQYGPEALKEAFKLWTLCQELNARTEAQAQAEAKKELEELFSSSEAPKVEAPKVETPKVEAEKTEVQAESTPSTPKRQITPEHKAKLRAGVLAALEAKKAAKAKEAMAVSEEEGLMAKTNIELVGIWASLTGRRSGLKQSKHHNKKEVVADIIRLRSDSEYRAAECARVKNKA